VKNEFYVDASAASVGRVALIEQSGAPKTVTARFRPCANCHSAAADGRPGVGLGSELAGVGVGLKVDVSLFGQRRLGEKRLQLDCRGPLTDVRLFSACR